jgi:dolichol-phosphate mannosyltransferase
MRLSLVIPLLNEEANLQLLYERLVGLTARLQCEREILFIDDGSTDRSREVIARLCEQDSTVRGISFSRNFGHEAASTAGLDHARGDAVVLMDADLQDPPELIEEMVRRWQQGAEIVYAQRRNREGETAFKRGTAWCFYRFLNFLSDVHIPQDTGDFRLMDRRVVEALRGCRESDRFLRGLVAWTGFRAEAVEYDRPARHGGETKYNALKLLWLSLDAAVGFSILPLRLATAMGFIVTIFSLVMVAIIVVQKLVYGLPWQGYGLLAAGMFFLGGVQMLLLGIVGEYIGRVYRQSQARPLYIVRDHLGEPGGRPGESALAMEPASR